MTPSLKTEQWHRAEAAQRLLKPALMGPKIAIQSETCGRPIRRALLDLLWPRQMRTGARHILIADADNGDRKQIRRALARCDLDCDRTEAASFEEALGTCKRALLKKEARAMAGFHST